MDRGCAASALLPQVLPAHGPFDVLTLLAGQGVERDRYMTARGFYSDKPEEGRQVNLFEQESLDAPRRDPQVELLPQEHRRNVTTSGVPLNHQVGRRFRIGDVVLEGHRLSTPCKHLEEITGKQVFNFLINRSGLNCRTLKSGRIRVGDRIQPDGTL